MNSQGKLSVKHMTWVEFLESYTFVLNHKLDGGNKVVDAMQEDSDGQYHEKCDNFVSEKRKQKRCIHEKRISCK